MKQDNVVAISDAPNVPDSCQLMHDLMAPICNIKAYNNELREISNDIENIIQQHEDVLPETVIDALRVIAKVDIDICNKALDRATESLELQLKAVVEKRS